MGQDGEYRTATELYRARAEAFPLIDVKEVAAALGVSVRTIRRWQASGKAPPRVKHGHRWKYNKADLGAWPTTKAIPDKEPPR